MTHRKNDRIMLVIVVCMLLLTILFMNGEKLGLQVLVDMDAESHSDSLYFTDGDLNGDPDTEGATTITLEGDTAKVSGTGAYVYDGNVVISESGTYVLSGTLEDGSVIVDAYDNSKVRVILDGVTIYCSDDAAFIVDQADKVFLTLAEGTENSLSSGAEYSEEALSDNTDGAVFAHDDLTINGTGSLTVTAAYKHGIAANDDLVITGGTITVEAAADGIRANDSIRICDAQINITAGDDGLVTAGEEAFLYIESGDLAVTAEDDAVHTTGDITIAGGALTLSAGDDAVHTDTAFAMTDGTLTVTEAYEGIEALTIDLQGGDISITCSDDGLNANGGTDAFGFGGMGGFGPGMDQTQDTAEEDTDDTDVETWIHISGGTLTIVNGTGRDADGIDSNGDILISGGTVLVSLVGDGSNNAIDYNSESGSVCEITGGTIIACGGASMAEGFDTSSTQPSILCRLSGTAEAGSLFRLLDADGTVLLEWEVPESYTCVTVSSPDLVLGGTYTISAGSGEEEVTLTEVSVSCGTDAGTGGFGGFGGMGGGMGGFFEDASEAGSGETSGQTQGQRPGRGGMHGGFGGRGSSQSSEEGLTGSDQMQGEMPEAPPEGMTGEMPEAPPEGMMGGFPEGAPEELTGDSTEDSSAGVPGGSDEAPEGVTGDSSEERPGAAQGGPEGAAGEDVEETDEDTVVAASRDIRDYDADVYLWLGLSVLAMGAGLAAAVAFRKRH